MTALKPTHKQVLESKRWKELRRRRIREVGGKCERCGASGVLELHHRHYQTLGEERPSDVEVVCRRCHAEGHGKGDPRDNYFRDLEVFDECVLALQNSDPLLDERQRAELAAELLPKIHRIEDVILADVLIAGVSSKLGLSEASVRTWLGHWGRHRGRNVMLWGQDEKQ